MDKKDLKISALLERVSNLTTESENKIADLRVELTMLTHERDELVKKLAEATEDDAKTDGTN